MTKAIAQDIDKREQPTAIKPMLSTLVKQAFTADN
jgi:hypothetical protein